MIPRLPLLCSKVLISKCYFRRPIVLVFFLFQLVSQSLKTSCKCHGVSGSCSIKTCWKALPSIQELGQALQRRYAVAVEVENRKVERRRKLVPVSPDRDQFSDEELIYYTKSSDYCLPDTSLGSLGTHGR